MSSGTTRRIDQLSNTVNSNGIPSVFEGKLSIIVY
jgi:hypothetical protein